MIRYQELRHRYEADGPEKTVQHLNEALQKGDLKSEDFSIRDLAEGLIPDGHEWVRSMDPRSGGAISLTENADGVDLTAFLNVTRHVIYSKILDAYKQEAFAISQLVETVPTRLDGKKISDIRRISDEVTKVEPGMPYPNVGFCEDYIETPSTTKRGLIVPVTKEAIFFDRTHLVLSRAAEVGEVLGLNKEKRLADLLVGVTNNYKWKGAFYDTYYTKADSQPWVNVSSGNELTHWTNVGNAEQLFADILDPNTSESVLLRVTNVLVMPAYRHAAHRVFNSSELTTAKTIANPLGNYTVQESRIAYRRILASGEAAASAKKWWFVGDFKKAFAYMENWPLTVTQSAPGGDADFNQDIVVRFKASERGTAVVTDPRFVVKNTG